MDVLVLSHATRTDGLPQAGQPGSLTHARKVDRGEGHPMTAAVIVTEMLPWRTRAACRDAPIESFYPPEPWRPGAYDFARALCATCPVWVPCTNAARTEHYGMWGGMTPHQRACRDGHRRRAS